MDVRKISGLFADKGVVEAGDHLPLPKEHVASAEVVGLRVVDPGHAGHALLRLEVPLPQACLDVLPFGHRALWIRDREVASLCQKLRIVVRRRRHELDLLLDRGPQAVEGRIRDGRIRFHDLVDVLPLVFLLDPEPIYKGPVRRIIFPEDDLVLGLLVVQDAASDMSVGGDGDLSPPLHLARAGLKGVHVPGVDVLVFLVVDYASGPLGVLVLRRRRIESELGVHLLAEHHLGHALEVGLQDLGVCRFRRLVHEVGDVLDGRSRLVFAVCDQVHVVIFHSVER